MGYFANAIEGYLYENQYCYECVRNHDEYGCPIWMAHELWNYDECNKKNSILHKMIPRSNGKNEECIFYQCRTGKEENSSGKSLST